MPPVDEANVATFSRTFVHTWLKHDLAFRGVVVSDDLGMSAVSAAAPLPDACVRAIAAGCDALLPCHSTNDGQVAAIEALIRAAEAGALPPRRLDDALGRQHDAKARFSGPRAQPVPPPRPGVIGCPEHQAIAAEMTRWL